MSTTADRVEEMIRELKLDQVRFAALAGASKSVVNQWINGKIKKIGPKYAYAIQEKSGYRAEWIMLGELPKNNESLIRIAIGSDETIAQDGARSPSLTEQEAVLINDFRALTEDQQTDLAIIAAAQAEANRARSRLILRPPELKATGTDPAPRR